MELKKNDLVCLEITGMTAEGMGVGRCQGLAIFVPAAAPGDTIQVRIVKLAKSHAYGRLEQILTPSACRQDPDCPICVPCGGCCYRHISYEGELAVKTDRVKDALSRIGGFQQLPMAPILAAPSRNHYRNKALLPLERKKDGSLAMGFYAVNSHRVINCESCRLQPPAFEAAMQAFRKWAETYKVSIYDEASHTGKLRRLFLRSGEQTGEIMVCAVSNSSALPHEQELVTALRKAVPGLSGVLLNSHFERSNTVLGKTFRTLWGRDTIQDVLCGLRFRISPLSFYQVNRTQAERLYEKAAEYARLTGNETLLDLYCGTGTIGLSMASKVKKLIGVEIVPEAVENAKQNALENGIENAEFICGDAGQAAALLAQRGESPQVIVLDPPRKGCSRSLIETVCAFGPERIVYISCDPATLARDLKYFAELGYPPQEAAPVDMFPGTAHVECVVLLSRA